MLVAEAQWLEQAFAKFAVSELSPLLNVGSGSAHLREVIQPWIDSHVFAPLRRRGVQVDHSDLQSAIGVDLCGDLMQESFVAELAGRGYRAICCSNVLEHVIDPRAVSARLEKLLNPGGYLIVTVPYRFPYHPDPIDTMFRPTVQDIVNMFPDCCLIRGEDLDCGGGWEYVDRSPRVLLNKLTRRLASRSQYGGLKGSASFLPWLFRRFRQTCVVLQKQGAIANPSQGQSSRMD